VQGQFPTYAEQHEHYVLIAEPAIRANRVPSGLDRDYADFFKGRVSVAGGAATVFMYIADRC
jgi:hypothetical protein